MPRQILVQRFARRRIWQRFLLAFTHRSFLFHTAPILGSM